MTPQNPSIDVIGLARCTGCFGCQSACPQRAIKLILDADGFYKPIVDREKCNECGICQRHCPVILNQEGFFTSGKWPEPKAFAAWSNEEQVRLASSSGGIFSELARPVIAAGGAVVGCVWGENWSPQHILTHTWADVERMRGSKYVPSQLDDLYQQVIATLRDSEKTVLFSGTPCQVAALEVALNHKQRERVLLVEFICHGVPSLRVFHRYLEELFGGEAVDFYTLRDKAFGWHTAQAWHSAMAVSAHGQCHHVPASKDAFFQGFAGYHLYVMESCHQCPFARLPRGGDITLGDFWGCPEQWDDRRGVSVVLANTSAGMSALERICVSGRINLKPTDLTTATAKNPRLTSGNYPIPSNRRPFLDGLAKGYRFAQLQASYFPSRWHLWWNSFRQSHSKLRFLAGFVYRRLRRIFRS